MRLCLKEKISIFFQHVCVITVTEFQQNEPLLPVLTWPTDLRHVYFQWNVSDFFKEI